jgi:hypothetical protein
MASKLPRVIPEVIEQVIYIVRGQKVLLAHDLARLYGVETRILNQAVSRNRRRFPADFMLRLAQEDVASMSQIVTSPTLRSQFVISKSRGGRRYLPYAFTEQGVAMLSSVLNSERAIRVNIEIIRAFVRLRQLLSSNAELAQKLAALEKKYDKQFKVVFHAIRQLMEETRPTPEGLREIGFHTIKSNAAKSRATRKLLS